MSISNLKTEEGLKKAISFYEYAITREPGGNLELYQQRLADCKRRLDALYGIDSSLSALSNLDFDPDLFRLEQEYERRFKAQQAGC